MRVKLEKLGKLNAALIAVVSVALITTGMLPFRQYLNTTEVALTLVLVVLLCSTMFGSRAGLAASLAGILSFNFFFLPPFNTLTISGAENWVAFGAFLITALIAGQLSGYARRRAAESETRQKKIERLYDELKDAVDQISEAEAIKRSEKLKSALLDAVTHDLRTPLTSIKASVTTLLGASEKADLDNASRREFLEIIDEETDRLNDFIEGMVGIAKVEAGATDLNSGAVASAEEIVVNALERARNQVTGHRLELAIEPGLPPVVVDAASVSQVVYTLLDNAAKYSMPGSRIRVSARGMHPSKVRILVEDQGAGIPKIDRDRVFEKFTRLDQNSNETGSGLGLGLAIARGMIESQGGRIWIEDGSQGFTTRVVCELPTKPAGSKNDPASA